MSCVAFIFARGGSKGVPRKNIKLLGGKPLIAYSIEIALQSKSIDRVIVSTDDEEIAEVARQFGAEVPFTRPAHLAQDTSAEWLSWQHAVDFVSREAEFDTFVSLPATSPLRSVEDVECCIAALDGQTDIVVTVKKAGNNPYFNMLKRDALGFSKLVIASDQVITRRQDAPEVFDMTTVAYVTRPEFIRTHKSLFDGRMKSIVIPDERAVDIDTPVDFLVAEALLQQKKESVQC
jgi:CMP-N-acetylneuraminic acid synthetase